MNWLKERWQAILVALGIAMAVLTAMAAARERKLSEKWQEKAVSIEEGTVTESLETANAASTQAKLHEQRAKDRKEQANAELTQAAGGADEEVVDILDRWSRT